MQQRFVHSHLDTTMTKVFVGGLSWDTTAEVLHEHFKQYGEIIEAVVILDKATAKSKGYGFVTFMDHKCAEAATKQPKPVIDNRTANVNLAAIGAKKKYDVIPLDADVPPVQPTTHSSTVSTTFASTVSQTIAHYQSSHPASSVATTAVGVQGGLLPSPAGAGAAAAMLGPVRFAAPQNASYLPYVVMSGAPAAPQMPAASAAAAAAAAPRVDTRAPHHHAFQYPPSPTPGLQYVYDQHGQLYTYSPFTGSSQTTSNATAVASSAAAMSSASSFATSSVGSTTSTGAIAASQFPRSAVQLQPGYQYIQAVPANGANATPQASGPPAGAPFYGAAANRAFQYPSFASYPSVTSPANGNAAASSSVPSSPAIAGANGPNSSKASNAGASAAPEVSPSSSTSSDTSVAPSSGATTPHVASAPVSGGIGTPTYVAVQSAAMVLSPGGPVPGMLPPSYGVQYSPAMYPQNSQMYYYAPMQQQYANGSPQQRTTATYATAQVPGNAYALNSPLPVQPLQAYFTPPAMSAAPASPSLPAYALSSNTTVVKSKTHRSTASGGGSAGVPPRATKGKGSHQRGASTNSAPQPNKDKDSAQPSSSSGTSPSLASAPAALVIGAPESAATSASTTTSSSPPTPERIPTPPLASAAAAPTAAQ